MRSNRSFSAASISPEASTRSVDRCDHSRSLQAGDGATPPSSFWSLDGPEKVALDGADGQAERRGDVLEHEVVVMAEQEDGLLLGRNLLQGLGDPGLELARLRGRGRVGNAALGQGGAFPAPGFEDLVIHRFGSGPPNP
jgi:hypothetical protein